MTQYIPMKASLLPVLMLVVACSAAAAGELAYQGKWNTTNRKLDGDVTCVMTPIAGSQWQGRFFGKFQGTPFDYAGRFSGTTSDLRGSVTVDGAHYQCRGSLNHDEFKANFTGSGYTGSFDLKRTDTSQVSSKLSKAR